MRTIRALPTLLLVFALTLPVLAASGMVIYNTKNGKYHELQCRWADKCTRNCVEIPRADAVQRGGTPCKVCHKR